jgi:8-oxo-dGTP pyrophosphatase MutT (NUDIX family)
MNGGVKNAALVLITGNSTNRVLFLRNPKRNTWVVPGGGIEKKDHSPFFAMKREFKEEVGTNLPYLGKNVPKFNYHGHTIVYVGKTTQKISFFPNMEVDQIHFPKLEDVLKDRLYVNGKKAKIEGYVLRSLRRGRKLGYY